ncbi:hypothetical protein FZEAL_250 [Fusarium zealandicum]|uniref:FAD-binding PCMH-type domain-containing protein n=1 Tax=Fusarium zealandicum TaxID=1053134 RepID=A0A8H4UVJ7_9HYPO|nr:hypothetical protein FZEAL_250 [Fusarium zealandicum]
MSGLEASSASVQNRFKAPLSTASSIYYAIAAHVLYFFNQAINLSKSLREPYSSSSGSPDLVKSYGCRPRLPIRVFVPKSHDPSSSIKLPTLFIIHGGGFVLGNARDEDPWTRAFADTHSTLVIALNYSKAPRACFPTPIYDLEQVVLAALSDSSLPLDQARIAIGGFSAGGNLALSVSTLPSMSGQGDGIRRIHAVVPMYAAMDMSVKRTYKTQTRRYKPALGGFRARSADYLLRFSPVFDWAYVPQNQDLRDPRLSPLFVSRDLLPSNVFVIACELDMLAGESWRMVCGLTGRPTGEERVGRDQPGRAGELILDDERYHFDVSEGGCRQMRALHRDSEHEKDAEPKTRECQRMIAEWLFAGAFKNPRILAGLTQMEFLAAGLSWALDKTASPQRVLGRLGLASLVAQNPVSWSELSAKLSPQASIILPDEPSFGSYTSRWREWHAPDVGVVVTAFTETDVQETILYANKHGLPFLARSGSHGATEALKLAENAVVIDLRGWNQVDIAEDGKTATIGAGASVKKVVRDLWDAGKQTVTGICECVGVSAPVLGGGHGWLQGQYGLASDQVISARVMLPSGEAVTASEEINKDLFWALRGAGHNFGIVTEWQYRIYNVNNPKWSYEILIFLGDKLEQVLELTNKMMKTQPPELTHWMYIPVIWYAVIYDGPADEALEYSKPLHDIGPINVEAGTAPMPDLAAVTLMSEDSVGCAKGLTNLRYPIGLKTYDPSAIRRVFDEITETSRRTPELAGSFFLLEGYSTQGVKAVDDKSSAYPHRDNAILVVSYIMYKPNASLDALAQEHGERLRGHLLEASGDPERLNAYVNYAHGDESLEAVYGWEEWRLERLRALKKKWDPKNRMRFYNPIV